MEHVEAINALNKDYVDGNFYLVKIQAIKIGGPKPAPIRNGDEKVFEIIACVYVAK